MRYSEYIRTRDRLIKELHNCADDNCEDCVLSSYNNGKNVTCEQLESEYPEVAEKLMSKWDKEHPPKTNALKFKEMFNAYFVGYGNSNILIRKREGDDIEKDISLLEWLNEEYIEPEDDTED